MQQSTERAAQINDLFILITHFISISYCGLHIFTMKGFNKYDANYFIQKYI